MLRFLAAGFALAALACVGQQKTGSFAPGTTLQERTHIHNQPVFDLAACQPRQLALPHPMSPGILVAAVFSARPQVTECLVDPKNRGPAATTHVMVETSVTDQAAAHTIHGDNLTAAGRTCIRNAVNALVPLAPLTKGAQPVEAQTEFFHELNNSPAVTFGRGEDSDFSGTLRLAQRTWCHCYAPFTTQAPPALAAKIKLTKTGATPVEIAFEPSGSSDGDMLISCLKKEIAALPVKFSSDEAIVFHRFFHLHSLAIEPAASLPPDLRYRQLELARGQRAAEAAIAFAAHDNAQEAYNAIAIQYNEAPARNHRLLPGLHAKCAGLLKAADAWIATIEVQRQVDQQTLMLVQELKTLDPGWARQEPASRLALINTETELSRAQKDRQQDEQACPQAHW
jgi:hypothetical protein